MKIIHCSDIHLDSGMETNLPPKKARERNYELRLTFARMISYAKENGVSVIMIAGDLFDTERVSSDTSSFVLDEMRGAPDMDFLYLRGNHDESRRAFAAQELPENLKLFSDEWRYYEYGDTVIAGIEMNRENSMTMYDSLHTEPGKTNIVMLHGQESTQKGEELVCISELRGKNIKYLALGHLHSFRKQKLDVDSEYCYCGCLEGRGFDECGEKGFVLLDVKDGTVRTEFIPFAKRTLHDITVDITGKTTESEIRAAIQAEAQTAGVPPEDMVKFTLHGEYTPETNKDISFLQKRLENDYYFVKIKDETRLHIEKGSYENDISLKGEFIRSVMASDLSEDEKDKIICLGIAALSAEEIRI